jgi:hypothetical protein
MKRTAFLLGALMLATNAVAGPVVAVNPVEAAPTVPQPPAVFGGMTRKFDLNVDGFDLKNASLHVDLFQVAGRLAMPLGKTVVPGQVDFPGRVTVSVNFPPVKSETDILARLSATNPSNPTPVAFGELRFAVFPNDLAKQIAALLPPLPNDEKRLVVFGAGNSLRPALTTMQIPFEDGGADVPGLFEPGRIYLGDVTTRDAQQQAQDRGLGSRIAVFSVDDSLPPGMYTNRAPNGAFILVSLPVLGHLADDPRAQLVLLKVIQSLTSN